MHSSIKAKEEEAAMIRNPIPFSSSSPSSQSPRPPPTEQSNQMGFIWKRKKPNIRILVDGEEKVVTPYFPLPPNAIVLDSKPQSSKRRAKNKGHIHSQSSDTVDKRQKKPNIRILVDGEEKVVTPYFPLPPNAIVLDPKPQSSKRRVKNKGHIHSQSSDNLDKRQKSATLSAAEKKLDIYKRVSHDNEWVAPRSPHQLLQEEHCYDPWRVLIICMLLNRTTGSQVKARGVLSELFKICPNAEAAANVQEEDLRDLLRPLGLQNKRAAAIKRLSSEYWGGEWTHVTQLYGVGKYAADAYAIFCVGKPEEVTPMDHKLVDYWKFVCEKRAHDNSIEVHETYVSRKV